MNKVILLGRLTKNPEIRFSQTNNTKVALFTLAVDRNYVKPGEERQTDFISLVAYSKLADFAEKYLKQGTQICMCGRMQVRNWTDDEGKRRYATDVIAEEIKFAESARKQEESNTDVSTSENSTENIDEQTITSDDDLPF